MPDRTVLPNCCEKWILTQGEFYELGQVFTILPCGHVWRREGKGEFRDQASVLWKVSFNKGFPYLEPEGADPPILDRCCSAILIEHGPQIQEKLLPLQFGCPVCNASWTITEGLGPELYKTRQYTNNDSQKTFRLQGEARPPFLELLVQRTPVT